MKDPHKVVCGWCARAFLTRDKQKLFCTDECQAKDEYVKVFPTSKTIGRAIADRPCKHCKTLSNKEFCTHECERLFHRKPELEKKKPKGGFLAYCNFEEENKKAERKRVFDDRFADRYIRGNTRDRI